MKKFVNDPQNFVPEMLKGIELANPGKLKYVPEYNLIMRTDAPRDDKVSIIQGSGSGHEPAHVMAVGRKVDECPERAAGQFQGGPARGQIYDAHVTPEHAVAEAGSQGLGASLLGGEALGVGGGAHRPPIGLDPFDIGEHAREKPVAVAFDGAFDAPDVNDVVAEPARRAPAAPPTAGSARRPCLT